MKKADQSEARRRAIEVKRESLKAVREALAGQESRLKEVERLAEVGMIASGIAHDLNSVLAVIMGYVEILRHDKSLGSEARRDIATIEQSATLGQAILSNYLRSARGREAPLSGCNLHQVLRSVLNIANEDLRRRSIQVHVDFARNLPGILGERVNLERLFLNLITNAAKAMSRGGILRLATELLKISGQGIAIRATVEDTGPGIPKSILPNLFKPFSTTREAQGGTGLGLYLSASIARQHGGMLYAENRDEGGARFTLYFPIPE